MLRPLFQDRRDAGQKLATRLRDLIGHPHTIVLGLSRGGVPVAFEVAKELHAPLDVFVVRKPGVPGPRLPSLEGATVILVDDGIATGATMAAAVAAVRQQAARVVVASPIMSTDALDMLSPLADRCECVATPGPFGAVASWYVDFAPTTDEEVRRLLATAMSASLPTVTAEHAQPVENELTAAHAHVGL
jgi:predicted phosphoribosyltransferase